VLDDYSIELLSEPNLKRSLMLELVRLDRMLEVFFAKALDGDHAAAIICTKISSRRSCLLGLDPQQGFAVTVISQPAPHKSSTGSIRSTLDGLLGIGSRERQLANMETHEEPMSEAERDELARLRCDRLAKPEGQPH
jgi:hypothetical protein